MSKRQKREIFKIIISAIVFVAGVVLKLEGIWEFTLFSVAYLIVGYDVLWSAIRKIGHGQLFDEEFLMSLATIGAFAISEYPEAVAVMLFYQVGELFQGIAVGKSRKSISDLMDIRPDSAIVLRDDKEFKVSPEEVQIGEIIVIRPGEKIPLDGIIIEGFTSVNNTALTGESLPQDKSVSDNVVSGSVNVTGVIKVKTNCTFSDSTVAKILELVENSASKKAKAEGFITRFSRIYTPFVVIGAVLLAVIPPLFFEQIWSEWINRALIFLVVSCPCALVISVPLSFFGGIGGASKRGILIKGSNYLEQLSKVRIIAFDKTGTLTKGNFEVTAIHPNEVSEGELLDLAATAESYSVHPIALSIIRAHKGHIEKSRIGEVKEISGQGVEAQIDGRLIYVGNKKLMEAIGAEWRDCHKSGTVIHLSENKTYLGHIVISDEIKPESKQAISDIKEAGIKKTVMLTGDIDNVGKTVGLELGIDEIYTELLPDNKVEVIEKLINERKNDGLVAFVGDGINDAPVLAIANVGIAMGALGSDAAIEAADVVLMDDSLLKIPEAISISRRTMGIVYQNIVFAIGIKILVLILGAFGFANMWLAVFADVGVTILAIINAMRALKK